MKRPAEVKLVEVGPRDGLQNEAKVVPVATRVEFIDRLSASGFPVIEVGALVSRERVPQMADSERVLQEIRRRPDAAYPLLVPNIKGFQRAVAAGAREIAVFTAATETFCRKNLNRSIAESLVEIDAVCREARTRKISVRGYVSCALGCPYEGSVPEAAVVRVAEALYGFGCREISLGDTIGVGTADRARSLVRGAAKAIPLEAVAVHFHDTYGQALANILAVLDLGVMTVDASVAGLGGCPFAPGAAGNVATEEVLYMFDGLGVSTGVDLGRLLEAGRFITAALGRPPASKLALAHRCRKETGD